MGVGVCRQDYVGKSGVDNPEEADDSGIGTNILDTNNTDGRVNDLGTGTDTLDTDDIDGRINNSGIGIDTSDTDDTDRRADNLGKNINIPDIDIDRSGRPRYRNRGHRQTSGCKQ